MKSSPTAPQPIPKVQTGIPSLDEVLHGGFPENRTTLIKGSAGAGKTVLGLEFLYHSAMNDEPAIFVSFEETAAAIRQNGLALGWDLAALEVVDRFFLWEAKIDRSAVTSGDFGLDSLLAVIRGKAEQMGARRLMIDAVDVLMRIFDDPVKERNELYRLHDWLVEQQFTTLLTAKAHDRTDHVYSYEFLDYMADCVLLLDTRVRQQVATRRLRVTKYRGSGFFSNEYPYLITAAGSVILPITALDLISRPLGEQMSSGNPELDQALGGGLHRASAVVISGPSGSGKTTLAATFTAAACERGEKVLYVSFEESQAAITAAMRSPGIELQPALEAGRLEFYTALPEALAAEEHLHAILQHLDSFQPDHLVVDAISASSRMGSDAAAFEFLVRLIHSSKARDVTCLMTNQLIGPAPPTPTTTHLDIASIVDTLISLRFVDQEGQIQRDLVILKSRGAHHSNRRHPFLITDTGIRLDVLAAGRGGD